MLKGCRLKYLKECDMRIIKLQQAVSAKGTPSPVQQRDVSTLIQNLTNSVPELSNVKNNPSLLKALSTFLGTFSENQPELGVLIPKIRDFCRQHDPAAIGIAQQNQPQPQTTSGIAPAIPGK